MILADIPTERLEEQLRQPNYANQIEFFRYNQPTVEQTLSLDWEERLEVSIESFRATLPEIEKELEHRTHGRR
jgi:hypothetical protein